MCKGMARAFQCQVAAVPFLLPGQAMTASGPDSHTTIVPRQGGVTDQHPGLSTNLWFSKYLRFGLPTGNGAAYSNGDQGVFSSTRKVIDAQKLSQSAFGASGGAYAGCSRIA